MKAKIDFYKDGTVTIQGLPINANLKSA